MTLLVGTTKRMDAGHGGDIKATWAGLTGSVMICVAAEIEASRGKKRGVDKTVTGILRRQGGGEGERGARVASVYATTRVAHISCSSRVLFKSRPHSRE